jgi:ferric-dicitrate binding protein FerR (iron transport regulator)
MATRGCPSNCSAVQRSGSCTQQRRRSSRRIDAARASHQAALRCATNVSQAPTYSRSTRFDVKRSSKRPAPCAGRAFRGYYGFVRLLAYPFLPPPVSLGALRFPKEIV